MMPGLFDDILNEKTQPVLIDKSGRLGQINPAFQSQIYNFASDFYSQFNTPLIITDSFRTQEEQAQAHRAKPTLALPAYTPTAYHPQGLAIDVDQSQAGMIPKELLAKHNLTLPAISKGETWHIEPISNYSNVQESNKVSGLFDDILNTPKQVEGELNQINPRFYPTQMPGAPQPDKIQSIPDLVAGAIGQQGVTQGEGMADEGQSQLAMPQRLESMVANYIPQSIKDMLGSGVGYAGSAISKILPTIPQTGALQGGYMGGKLGAMTGNPIGMLGGGLLGAGLGYVGAQQAENVGRVIEGEQMPPIPEQLKEAGKGFLTGVTGEAGGQSFGAMMRPFANKVANRIAENEATMEAQRLVEKGAPISPSEISGSKFARGLEWLAEKVWPASSKMAKQRQSLQGFAEGLKNEFVQSRGLYDVSKQSVGEAWDNWVKMAGGPDVIYPMPLTTQAVEEAMKKPFAQMGAFWKKHAATFADAAKNGEVTVQVIRDIFNTLNPTAAKGAERTARMKIADSIVADLGNVGGPEVTEALGVARNMTYMNRVAGPLRAIFNQSMIEPTRAGETVMFNPSKFVNLWNQKRPNFIDNKNYSDIDIATIDKFANQMRAMIPDLAKGQRFTAPTSLGGVTQFNLENPLAVGGAIYKQPLLALPVGVDYWLAGSLMNPEGYIRKFLTTGLKPPILPVKVGIMKGVEND